MSAMGMVTMAKITRKTVSIKMYEDVIESARIVSALQGKAMTDLLGDILKPILNRLEKEELSRRAAELDPPAPKGRKKAED